MPHIEAAAAAISLGQCAAAAVVDGHARRCGPWHSTVWA